MVRRQTVTGPKETRRLASRLLVPGRVCAPVLALALALVPPAGARAQEDVRPEPTGVGSTVEGESTSTSTATPTATSTASDAEVPALDEVVVIGRRPRGQVARDPTASATVIDAARFAGEAKGVAELVATAPGVAVSDYGGLGHLSTISIRGSSSDSVLVLVDGLPLNGAVGGSVDLASIPRHWIDRIEVVRGAEGAVYGAGALGGVVNVITRSGAAPWSAEATAGSFGSYSAAADASAGGPGAWVLATASGETTSGRFDYLFDPLPAVDGNALVPERRDNNGSTRGGILVKAGLASPARRWDALLSVSGGRREVPGSPYALTPYDAQRDGRVLASLRLAVPAGGGRTFAARVTGRGDLLDGDVTRMQGGQRAGPATVTRQRGGAATLELEGVQQHRGGALSVRGSATGETLSATGAPTSHDRSTLSAAVSDDLRLGAVRVGPALRVDRIGPFSGWSGKLGAGVPLVPSLALRASAGRTYRAPTFSELYLQQATAEPNPSLHSETGTGGDAALVAEGRWGFASLGGHASLYDDQIVWVSVGRSGVVKPFNEGRTLASGLEVEGATAPLGPAGLALEGSYTFLRAEILRGSAAVIGKDVPHRPRHRLFVRLSAAPPDGAGGAHVEAHLVGRQFEDDFNVRPIPAATVWNAGAWLRVWRRPSVRLQLEVKNLLDDRTLLDPAADPLPGRMVLVTLRVESLPTKGRSAP
jgi:iron complex outermembrane receptor protein